MGQTWYSKIAKQRADNAKSSKNSPLLDKGHDGDEIEGHTHVEKDVKGNFKNQANESVKITTNTIYDAGKAKVDAVEGQASKTRLSWSDAWKQDLEGIQGKYENEAAYRADMKGQTNTAEKKKAFEAGVTKATGRDSIGFTPDVKEVKEEAYQAPKPVSETHTETVIKDTVKDPQVWNAGLESTIQGNIAARVERSGQKKSDRRSVRDTFQNLTKDQRKAVRAEMKTNRKDGSSKKGRLNQRADAMNQVLGEGGAHEVEGYSNIDFARHQSAKNKTTKGNKAYEDSVVTGSQNKNASAKDMYSGGGGDETINKQADSGATEYKPRVDFTSKTDFGDDNFGKTEGTRLTVPQSVGEYGVVDFSRDDSSAKMNPVNAGKAAYKLKNSALKKKLAGRGAGY